MSRVYPETFQADYSRLDQTPFTRSALRAFRSVVVGAGALGNEVTRILGLLGTGSVTVVDPDVVESSNLPRSIYFNLHRECRIGQNKALALIESAAELFPDTDWAAQPVEIADVGFQSLAQAHLLLNCTDSDLARVEVAYISKTLNVPLIDGALGRHNYSHGRVTYFPTAADQACYACMLTPSRRAQLLQTWQSMVRPCFDQNDATERDLVSTPMMASVIGGIQVELGLRNCFQVGTEQSCRGVELRIHPEFRLEEIRIPVSADCPFHQARPLLVAPARQDSTFEDLMNQEAADVVLLDWPVCVSARCLDCETEWAPMLRLAPLRRNGKCPACSSSKLLELQHLRTIPRESAWARHTPSELQLPTNHLYSLHPRPNAL
jgi:molybdopterin/thiamine biosynthesis adenylyltransferase